MLRALAAAALVCASVAAAADTSAELFDLSQHSAAPLTDRNYAKFAMSRSKPYHLFVLYTARESQYQCSICGAMESEFLTAAESYWRDPASQARRDIYFAVVNFPSATQTFRKHDLKSVPVLAHFAPEGAGVVGDADGDDDGASGTGRWRLRRDQLFDITDTAIDAEAVARFVKTRTGAQITIYRSPLPGLIFAASVLALLAVVAKLAWDNLPLVLGLVRSASMWRYLCMGVYVISISGFVFDIIRNPPAMHCTRAGCTCIHPQSGTQFVVEGFIIGGLNLACAAAVVALAARFKGASDVGTRSTYVVVALVVFALLYSQILALYRYKNGWYPFRLLF